MSRREQLEQMLQDDADDLFLNYALAMAWLAEGNAETGIEQLQHVIDLDGDYVAAYFQQGQALARENRIDQAREALSSGIKVARKIGDTHAEREMSDFLNSL